MSVDRAGTPLVRGAGPAAPAPRSIGARLLDWLRALAAGVLWTAAFLMILALVPRALGWTPLTIRSGSMEPTINRGDILHAADREVGTPLGPGAIAVYDRPGADELVSHRVVETTAEGFVTKGDNNPAVDTWGAVADHEIGHLGRMIVPYAGLPGLWLSEGRWDRVVLVLALLGGSVALVFSGSEPVVAPRRHRHPPPTHRRTGHVPGAGRATRARRGRGPDTTATLTYTTAGALVLCLGAAVPLSAAAAFAGFDSSSANSVAAAASFPTWSATVSAGSPPAWYRLSGDADDESGSNDGTGAGGVTFGGASLLASDADTAAVFDGVDDVVTLPDTEDLGGGTGGVAARTIELWFHADDTSGRQTLVELGDSTSGFNLYLDGTTLHGRAWSSSWSTDLEVSTTVAAGTTHHVALVVDTDPNTIELYLDGTSVDTGADTETTTIAAHRSSHGIGAVAGSTDHHDGARTTSDPFDGRIDEVVIDDAALTASAIATRHAAGL